MVKFTFPARDNMPKVAMPEVEVYWYDGGMKPMRPKVFPKTKFECRWWRCHFPRNKRHIDLRMLRKKALVTSGRDPKCPPVLREVKETHEMDFVRACKENASSRIQTTSPSKKQDLSMKW